MLAFRRGDVLTIVNLGAEEAPVTGAPYDTEGARDIFTGATAVPATLPAGGYMVFVKE